MPFRPMSAIWKRAQAFGQPLMLTVSGTSKSGSRRLHLVDQRACRGPWSPRSPACRTRCRCRPSSAGGTASGAPAGPSDSSAADQVTRLCRSGTSRMSSFCSAVVRIRPVPCSSARSAILRQQRAGDPADRRGEAHVEVAVLLRVHADVVARSRPAAPPAPGRR